MSGKEDAVQWKQVSGRFWQAESTAVPGAVWRIRERGRFRIGTSSKELLIELTWEHRSFVNLPSAKAFCEARESRLRGLGTAIGNTAALQRVRFTV